MTGRMRTINIPIFVPHLGCPNDCVFCDQHKITMNAFVPNAERVRALIEETLKYTDSLSTPVRIEAAFFGGSFTAIDGELRRELLSAAHEYRGRIDGIRLSTRPDAIDESILSELRAFGVTAIELGAQSMSDRVLRLSNRGHTSDDTRRAARMIREGGFSLGLQMMTGLVGDDRETCLYTARELIALRPDTVRIYPCVVIPGTRLWDMAERGEYTPQSVSEAVSVCAELIPMFTRENTTILRVGLMENEILSSGEVKGAYHPSLGELCYSRVFYNAACRELERTGAPKRIEIRVPLRASSKMTGHKRENIEKLRARFSLGYIKVREDESLKDFEVQVNCV